MGPRRQQRRKCGRRTELRALEEIPGGTRRNDTLGLIDCLRQQERQDIAIYTAAGPFRLIEDAEAAADNCVIAERTPRKSDSRAELGAVSIGNRIRETCLTAGLNKPAEKLIGSRSRILRRQINLIGITFDDDRPGLCRIECAQLAFVP